MSLWTAGSSVAQENPVTLLEEARAALATNDFAVAETRFDAFFTGYGANPEAAEAVKIHTPLMAITKVGVQNFPEALEWIEKSFADPELDRTLADELAFWKGVCHMQQGNETESLEAFGEYWADETHNPFKRYEALVSFATILIQGGYLEAAADFLADQVPKIEESAPEAASRGRVLQLYALTAAGLDDRALALVRAQYPRLDEMTQVITFQTLALKLGTKFLNQKDYHRAIACLQRISRHDELLAYQQDKATRIADRIEVLRARGSQQATIFQLEGIQKRVSRELENFGKIENFDSALRLRLAFAFQGLERYREAALVMEDMLKSLPADPVVEGASLALIQCWLQIDRWPKAIEAADAYIDKFGHEGPSAPSVLFFKADAHQQLFELNEAALVFDEIIERFPDHELAPKAMFMQGFMYLQQDDNDGALFHFSQVEQLYPESPMVEDAGFWSGQAIAFSKDYEGALEHLGGYLDRYKTPKYRKEADFRIAVCTFSLANYLESVELFEAFITAYPGDGLLDEARLLQGDALFAEGEIERGIASYEAITPESTRFFEDAWFKIGKAHKLTEAFDDMRKHYERFLRLYPRSKRMPEAVYWLGWLSAQAGDSQDARETYMNTLMQYGNDPSLFSMADLITGMPRAYKDLGEERETALIADLQKLKRLGKERIQPTLELRAMWGLARAQEKSAPLLAEGELLGAAKWIDPKRHNPVIAIDIAEIQQANGYDRVAEELYREIRRWNPRTIVKDRIYAGLGKIEEDRGDAEAAIEYYEKFEIETANSSRLGEIQLAKSRLLGGIGRGDEAKQTLEGILASDTVGSATKAKSLMTMGEILAGDGESRKAAAYFERVYISYGKYRDQVATAYLSRGKILEEMNLTHEAREVYTEMVDRKDLMEFPERKEVSDRLDRLGGPIVPAPVVEPVESETARTGEEASS